ncbi:hypothetical protein CS0771_02900 [Catellatospora sp. IY07-71]|uniref:DUF6585 family protein n=1 Tax=Catellatospora sp. IY07-71 TaxID=2728827 RepID=UPI001BB32BF9|nr:DUF6585 family protein [Catellatospora sp. IY07-71]BCJ70746.1 hypothetical protein CS0771_02900 [Catellatospora sp. IY07-71]
MTVDIESTAAVPAEVTAAAAGRDLGAHRETYPAKWNKQASVGLGIFVALFGVIAVFATVGASSSATEEGQSAAAVASAVLWGITALFLAGFLWILLRSPAVSKTARGFQVHLFERGWVWVRRKGTEVYRFDEVQTLFAAIVVVNNSGVTTTVYDYRITCNDGRQTRMRQIHTDMARFGPALAAQVAQAQLPKALSYFDKGNPVAFGDLTVTEDGLATKKGKVVPWSQVGGVQVVQGFVSVVDRAGKRVSPQVSFGQMPNAHTFLLMTETILAKLRGTEQ